MLTIYSAEHARHDPKVEMADGALVPAVEIPARAEMVLRFVRDADLGPIEAPDPLDRALVEAVHTPDYVAFLEGFWQRWLDAGRDPHAHDTFPFVWPTRGLRRIAPRHLDGLMGRYSFDAGTPMGPGTWAAAASSAAVAQTGARRLLAHGDPVFALCRPPGHHAMADAYGGYCFLNNAAIAAETLRQGGLERVAILDVDYHHGNGTQAIFEARSDVLFVSIHADPMDEYPYFLGHADETGSGPGAGYTRNLPLAFGTAWPAYSRALDDALGTVADFAPDALVLSLGMDTFHADPISKFALEEADFPRLGAQLAAGKWPTLFVFEGGYAVDALGRNTLGVLQGFEGGG
ncbi:MAG: histone deacetylase family protein [Devosiaceae bacterium]|nr:histone deacetylase family protein [Devosiaceae bacterium MH13]